MAEQSTLWTAFESTRRSAPQATALVDVASAEIVTRDGLARLVDTCDRLLASAPGVGARSGRRFVGCWLANEPLLVATLLACWRRVDVPALLDRELTQSEVERRCEILGMTLVAQRNPAGGLEVHSPRRLGPRLVDPGLDSSVRLVKLTSGSTGDPRGVMLTDAALQAGFEQIAGTMGIGPGDRNLVTIPLTHSYGFDNVILPLLFDGVPAILCQDLTPRHLVRVAAEHHATVFPAVPFLLDLLSRSPVSSVGPAPSLRLVISAGAPLSVGVRTRFAERFGARPRNFYGSTEVGGIAFDRTGEAELDQGAVGSALDGVSIELESEVDGIGRVVVHSRAAASKYLMAEGQAGPYAADLLGSRFRTSDLGRYAARGELCLVGRVSDVINVGGRKVFPAEVERVIRGVEGVRDVVVIGESRSAATQSLRAIVVADHSLDRKDIIAACARALARFKIPRSIEFRSSLPRNQRGKIDLEPLESWTGGRGSVK